MTRALSSSLHAAVRSGTQTPALQVMVQDLAVRFSTQASSPGPPGRTAAVVTGAGTLLRATVTQGTDPNGLVIQRMRTGDTVGWSDAGVIVVAAGALAPAGCGIGVTGSTIRVFFQDAATRRPAYVESGDDGQTWAAPAVLPGLPLELGNYCYGIAAGDTTQVWAAYGAYDPHGACGIYAWTFSGGAWSGPASVGPPSPAYGAIRGLQVEHVGGVYYFSAGVQTAAGVTGIAACTTTFDDTTWTPFVTIAPMDNPNLGLQWAWPAAHFDAASETWLLAVTIEDDGSVSGTPGTRTTVYTSDDFQHWNLWATPGGAFSQGAHAMVIGGATAVFDNAACLIAAVPAGPTDVSDDVLSLHIEEGPNRPATASIVLANLDGTYTSWAPVRGDATVTVSLGYGNETVTAHLLAIDGVAFAANPESSTLTLTCSSALRLLNFPSDRTIVLAGDTIGGLVETVARYAGMPLAPLPTTEQFSTAVPCFTIVPGETWLQALQRLAGIYDFAFHADASGRLVCLERSATDPVTWTYGSEVAAEGWAESADRANVVRVIGASSTQSVPPFAEAADVANIAATGRMRYRYVVDRMLDTAAKCALRAGFVLQEEQRNATACHIEAALNPAHELQDVISVTDEATGLSGATFRIAELSWQVTPESGEWGIEIVCTGV